MQCSFLVLLIVQHILISCVNKDVLRPHDSPVLDFPRVYFQLQVVGRAVDPLYNEEHDVLDSRVSGGKIFSFLVSLTYSIPLTLRMSLLMSATTLEELTMVTMAGTSGWSVCWILQLLCSIM